MQGHSKEKQAQPFPMDLSSQAPAREDDLTSSHQNMQVHGPTMPLLLIPYTWVDRPGRPCSTRSSPREEAWRCIPSSGASYPPIHLIMNKSHTWVSFGSDEVGQMTMLPSTCSHRFTTTFYNKPRGETNRRWHVWSLGFRRSLWNEKRIQVGLVRLWEVEGGRIVNLRSWEHAL